MLGVEHLAANLNQVAPSPEGSGISACRDSVPTDDKTAKEIAQHAVEMQNLLKQKNAPAGAASGGKNPEAGALGNGNDSSDAPVPLAFSDSQVSVLSDEKSVSFCIKITPNGEEVIVKNMRKATILAGDMFSLRDVATGGIQAAIDDKASLCRSGRVVARIEDAPQFDSCGFMTMMNAILDKRPDRYLVHTRRFAEMCPFTDAYDDFALPEATYVKVIGSINHRWGVEFRSAKDNTLIYKLKAQGMNPAVIRPTDKVLFGIFSDAACKEKVGQVVTLCSHHADTKLTILFPNEATESHRLMILQAVVMLECTVRIIHPFSLRGVSDNFPIEDEIKIQALQEQKAKLQFEKAQEMVGERKAVANAE